MRTNLPVTDVEHPIDDDTLIVSKTDPNGKLVYFNKQFVDASGFMEAELMGQPHNIVRHPDMPSEAFAAHGTRQVSSNVADAQRGASETGSESSQVLSAAQSLSRDSNRLKVEVGKFLDTVRAA